MLAIAIGTAPSLPPMLATHLAPQIFTSWLKTQEGYRRKLVLRETGPNGLCTFWIAVEWASLLLWKVTSQGEIDALSKVFASDFGAGLPPGAFGKPLDVPAPQAVLLSVGTNSRVHKGAVIEVLKFDPVPCGRVPAFLEAENRTHTRYVVSRPGFLNRLLLNTIYGDDGVGSEGKCALWIRTRWADRPSYEDTLLPRRHVMEEFSRLYGSPAPLVRRMPVLAAVEADNWAVDHVSASGALATLREDAATTHWYDEWQGSIQAWWLATPHRDRLGSCIATLGLHLASRFDLALKAVGLQRLGEKIATATPPPAPKAMDIVPGCEWVVDSETIDLKLPYFPDFPNEFQLPPILPMPRLLPQSTAELGGSTSWTDPPYDMTSPSARKLANATVMGMSTGAGAALLLLALARAAHVRRVRTLGSGARQGNFHIEYNGA